MDGTHSIDGSYKVTDRILQALLTELFDQRVKREGTLLKTNMVVSATTRPSRQTWIPSPRDDKCLENTSRCGARFVFLSGGMSDEDATARLNAMNQRGPHPWELSFSYGRALQAPALKACGGEPSNWRMRRRRSTGARSSTAPPAPARTRLSGRRQKSLNEELLQSARRALQRGRPLRRLLTHARASPGRRARLRGRDGRPVPRQASHRAGVHGPAAGRQIVILRTRESGDDFVVADYAWRAEPAARAGSMILRLREAEIDRLLVTFG